MEYSQHHTLLSTLVRQLKVTTYQCWISVYAPLFWFLSATLSPPQHPSKHFNTHLGNTANMGQEATFSSLP
ncbi:hypothetical protein BY458DRAFT_514885 [Sporodiniella umbellata]|nr:hypothetical protein BY458DRAFT_514885 [Sporodiniella umbellata]